MQGALHLLDVTAHLDGEATLAGFTNSASPVAKVLKCANRISGNCTASRAAKRALEIATAGEHNLLMLNTIGPRSPPAARVKTVGWSGCALDYVGMLGGADSAIF